MLETIFNTSGNELTMISLSVCTGVSLFMGFLLAALHRYRNRSSRNFLMTLVLLPAMVQVVIMLVNGNLGAGVAVMGAFGLVRFRSMPGNAREIGSVFLAMTIGLADGMGYIGISALLMAVVGLVTLLLLQIPDRSGEALHKDLRVTIPENLDYAGIFDDIFANYTRKAQLVKVKTVNMGSLYELEYEVELKKDEDEKKFLDEIRCRNGNLTIVCGRMAFGNENL